MNLLMYQLRKRKEYLENLQADIMQGLELAPEGKLRASNDKGKIHYYCITKAKDSRGQYISKKEKDLVYRLAQKDYMQKLYKEIQEELDDINAYFTKYGENRLENVYNNLNEYRKDIVTPMVLSDTMYAEHWEKESYNTNEYCPEEKVYPTKKDELVRSKSEVLLADMYYELGIPYRYEAQLQLKNGKKKYPDFTLLKVDTRDVIYHEHLGLLDNEEYRQANLVKLEEYRKNGIYPGKNLIITYEAEGCYLNIKEIKQMIQEMFWESSFNSFL